MTPMTDDQAVLPNRGVFVRLRRALLAGLVVAALVAFVALLVRERFGPLIHADDVAIRAATDVTRRHPALLTALLDWQWLFQPTRVYLVASVVCLWTLLAKRLRGRSWWAFLTMMLGWSVALAAKYVVRRARPLVEDPVSHAPGYSFPSGHVANAAVAATALTLLLWPLLPSRPARTVAVVLGVLIVGLTGLDRVFLGVHFPSDAVGGVLIGGGLVLASYAGYVGNPPATTPDSSKE